MIDTFRVYQDLAETLGDAAAQKLASVLSTIYTDLKQTVTKEDFRELKEAVTGLAEAQGRTDEGIRELKEAVIGLAKAQARTDERIGELVARTDERFVELAARTDQLTASVERLVQGIDDLRGEVGGNSRTMGYALENEAYRALPGYLLRERGLRVTDRFVRTEVSGEEVNFLAHAEQADGTPVLIVGESKARLDERRRSGQQAEGVLSALRKRVDAAARVHPGVAIVPMLVTHYARPAFLQAARAEGVMVVQSFEW